MKGESGSARFLGGLARPADCLQVRLGDINFKEFAPEDPLDDLLGRSEFFLLLSEASFGRGAVGVAAFLQPQSPVLVRATAEAVLDAPRDVLLDARESEGLDVRQYVGIKLVGAILFGF